MPLSEPAILSYFIQICLGLRHIHAQAHTRTARRRCDGGVRWRRAPTALQRVIHRDIKPLNLFVDASDRIKIGDMGVSRIVCAGACAVPCRAVPCRAMRALVHFAYSGVPRPR